jgi:hypothetical protein
LQPDERILASISIPSDVLSGDSPGRYLTHGGPVGGGGGGQWPRWPEYANLASSAIHGGWQQQSLRSDDFRNQQRFDFLGFETAALFVDADAADGDEARGGHGHSGPSNKAKKRVVVGPVFGCKMCK